MESSYLDLLYKAISSAYVLTPELSKSIYTSRSLTNPLDSKGTILSSISIHKGLAWFDATSWSPSPQNATGSFRFTPSYLGATTGRVGTFYGISEVAGCTIDGNGLRIGSNQVRAQNPSETFAGHGVTANDIFVAHYINPSNISAISPTIRKILTLSTNDLSLDGPTLDMTHTAVYGTILKLAPVELFAVPNSGPIGQEQVFLTTGTLTDTERTKARSDYSFLNSKRVFPLVDPITSSMNRIDGPFQRATASLIGDDSDWGFRMVLFPALADGSGPDLTKPIANPNPTIDPAKSWSNQEMLIDYHTGTIIFSTPPVSGSDINPNSTTGPLRLWAVFCAYTYINAAVTNRDRWSRGILDYPAQDAYTVPAYVAYNTSQNTWQISSGQKFNAYGTTYSSIQANGISFGDDIANLNPTYFCRQDRNNSIITHAFSDDGTNGDWAGSEIDLVLDEGHGLFGISINQACSLLTNSDSSWFLNSWSSGYLGLSAHDISTGITGLYSTNTALALAYSTTGGSVTGLSSGTSTHGLGLTGYSQAEDTTTTSSSIAPVLIQGGKRSGTSTTSLGITANLVAIQNASSTVFVMKANGNLLTTGSYGNYDAESDALACQDLAYALAGRYDSILKYQRPELERIGVMTHGFLDLNNMFGLQLGAIGELYQIVSTLCEKLGLRYEDLRKLARS